MMALDVSVNDEHFNKLMAEYLVRTKRTIPQAVRSFAGTLSRALMEHTHPPMEGRNAAEGRVVADIRRVYLSQSEVYLDIQGKDKSAADAFWYYSTLRKWRQAQQIMSTDSPSYSSLKLAKFDDGQVHERMRGKRGKISKGVRPIFAVKETGKRSKLEAYIKKKKERVGMAKAGWYHCWKQSGTPRSVPQWIKRHRGQLGHVITGDEGRRIVIHNLVRHAEEAMQPLFLSRIHGWARGRFIKFLELSLAPKGTVTKEMRQAL